MDIPRDLTGVRVCRFGHFSGRYARNRVIAKALRRAGATVEDVMDHRPYPIRTPAMLSKAMRLRFDLLLVGYPGHSDVPAAVTLARLRGTPVVFDALLSLYDTFVEDRRRMPPGSIRSRWPALVDRLSTGLADRVLLDTAAHIDFFVRELGASRAKFRRIWVGADDDVIRPMPRTGDPVFTVFLYASFIPLQGVDQVVRAARLLEEEGPQVRFRLVGRGPAYPEVRALASKLGVRSIEFLGKRPYEELAGLMAAADVCLGIFGTTPKAGRVIPNKVFDGLAAGRAVITADTPAAREALVHGRHAWLVPAGDPRALAEGITRLGEDGDLRDRLAREGRLRFEEAFSIDATARDMSAVVREVVGR